MLRTKSISTEARNGDCHAPTAALAGVGFAPLAQAHEKRFIAGDPPPRAARGFVSPFCLSAVSVAAGVTPLATDLWRRRNRRDLISGSERLGATDESLARFYGIMAALLVWAPSEQTSRL